MPTVPRYRSPFSLGDAFNASFKGVQPAFTLDPTPLDFFGKVDKFDEFGEADRQRRIRDNLREGVSEASSVNDALDFAENLFREEGDIDQLLEIQEKRRSLSNTQKEDEFKERIAELAEEPIEKLIQEAARFSLGKGDLKNAIDLRKSLTPEKPEYLVSQGHIFEKTPQGLKEVRVLPGKGSGKKGKDFLFTISEDGEVSPVEKGSREHAEAIATGQVLAGQEELPTLNKIRDKTREYVEENQGKRKGLKWIPFSESLGLVPPSLPKEEAERSAIEDLLREANGMVPRKTSPEQTPIPSNIVRVRRKRPHPTATPALTGR